MASNPLSHPCNLSTTQIPSTEPQNRRTVNYHHPNQWTHEIIQSLGNHLTDDERVEERARKLEENVRFMVNRRDMDTLSLLEFVDDIERLGLSYKFDEDINTALQWIVSIQTWSTHQNKTLHETALSFRLLRQYGFHVSQDVFKNFKDKEGNFKSEISNDVQGLLSLYEASYLALEGESVGEANAFSRTHLMNLMKEGIEEKMVKQVKHALEGLPYHHGHRRLETSHYINIYHKPEPHHRLLLELAKLDFNMVQSLQQKELEELSRWWRDIGLASKFNFIRDRIVEIYIWSIGMYPDPRLTNCRIELAKVGQLITAVDDIYDFYGTLDELELFTDAFQRWDVNTINILPDYMMMCFLAVFNTVNEMAYDKFKERGVKCLPYLKNAWFNLCKSYLQEAKWFYKKVIPSFKEFIENGLNTSSGEPLLVHSYFAVSQGEDITEQALRSLTTSHDLLRSLCIIMRLTNDLGTAKDEAERGETSISSISTYMHQTGFSEENANQYVTTLIDKEWHILNKYLAKDSIFPKAFTQSAIDLARASHCIYYQGDGFGIQDNLKSRIKSLLVDPIQLMCHDDDHKVF